MLEDMVLRRARVIAVLEAAGHASRGDHSPVYSGRGAGLRPGIAAALRAGGLGAHELDNRINVPPEASERAVSAGYAAGLEPDQGNRAASRTFNISQGNRRSRRCAA